MPATTLALFRIYYSPENVVDLRFKKELVNFSAAICDV